MKVNVIYQRSVLDDGDFIISAELIFSKECNVESKDINFSLNGEKLAYDLKRLSSDAVEVKFHEPIPVLKFNLEKFVNEINLPKIIIEIINHDVTEYNVVFKKDKFVKKFDKYIFQSTKGLLSYMLFSSHQKEEKRPLVIFLHGSGERGFSNELPLLGSDVVKTIYKYVKHNEDAVVLVPQATWMPELNGWFRPEVQNDLLKLIGKIMKDENIDSSRVYLVGLSNGASATWQFGESFPNLFTALVPCSGYVYNNGKKFQLQSGQGRYMEATQEEARKLSTLPIWAFHVEDDPVVNVNGTINIAEKIKRLNGEKLKVSIYPKGEAAPNAHASWALAFNNSKLLPWLFSQKKL
ncbi:phospholipase [Ligilactobacillus sp. WILCCON 0076]|uniref:Phospholipase n=1 Tax=Ligilactobacillus ubinensis TaxID=2876789 RepID=A0A9X2FR05_9LACO|nr:PHB depolymerase family esterase [Ligilactobacillus ubinensis]MCP0887768.1 phospholipase [Ligilactobacillus ubinensis]